MTREEAISIMNVIVHMLEPQYDTDRIEDAVEMAIEALKQEPEPVYFPPCVDCHDRSKKILTAYDNMKKMQMYSKKEVITMLEEIKTEIKKKEKEYLHDLFIGLDVQDKTEHEKIIDIIDQKIEMLKR